MTLWGLVGQEGSEENREWSQHHRDRKRSESRASTPGFSTFTTTAVTTGSATKETRPYPESGLHLV